MMFSTILFDLDGTLLPIDMTYFLKKYFHALGQRCSGLIEPSKLSAYIMDSTEAMVENMDPSETNMEVFYHDFLSRVSEPRSRWETLFDGFYQEDFPGLEAYSKGRNPWARMVVEDAIKQGYRVVIATNPVFPRSAILERMRWADVVDFEFDLVTSYENMHFCKPKLEYYQEILEILDVGPGEVLMVGNDMEEDIVASRLGIRTFLLDEGWVIDRGLLGAEPDFRGDFKELARFLKIGKTS